MPSNSAADRQRLMGQPPAVSPSSLAKTGKPRAVAHQPPPVACYTLSGPTATSPASHFVHDPAVELPTHLVPALLLYHYHAKCDLRVPVLILKPGVQLLSRTNTPPSPTQTCH